MMEKCIIGHMESSPPSQSDAELAQLAGRGDHAAFGLLVERYASLLYGLAVRLVGEAADAEDVLQETLAGAFGGLGGFRGQASVKTYLTRILMRQAAAHHRRRARRLRLWPARKAAEASLQLRADVRMDLAAAMAQSARSIAR